MAKPIEYLEQQGSIYCTARFTLKIWVDEMENDTRYLRYVKYFIESLLPRFLLSITIQYASKHYNGALEKQRSLGCINKEEIKFRHIFSVPIPYRSADDCHTYRKTWNGNSSLECINNTIEPLKDTYYKHFQLLSLSLSLRFLSLSLQSSYCTKNIFITKMLSDQMSSAFKDHVVLTLHETHHCMSHLYS